MRALAAVTDGASQLVTCLRLEAQGTLGGVDAAEGQLEHLHRIATNAPQEDSLARVAADKKASPAVVTALLELHGEIGEDAFPYCSVLKEVSIPSSVTQIGGGAFQGCSALEEGAAAEDAHVRQHVGCARTVGRNAGAVQVDTDVLPASVGRGDDESREHFLRKQSLFVWRGSGATASACVSGCSANLYFKDRSGAKRPQAQ